MIEPASREGKKPLAVDAPIRDGMNSICKTCAYASDLCKYIRKKTYKVAGVSSCKGYVEMLRGDK